MIITYPPGTPTLNAPQSDDVNLYLVGLGGSDIAGTGLSQQIADQTALNIDAALLDALLGPCPTVTPIANPALDAALQIRNDALSALNTANKQLNQLQEVLEQAMQNANAAQQAGLNSTAFQNAQMGVLAAQKAVTIAAQNAFNAQQVWQAANDAVVAAGGL